MHTNWIHQAIEGVMQERVCCLLEWEVGTLGGSFLCLLQKCRNQCLNFIKFCVRACI